MRTVPRRQTMIYNGIEKRKIYEYGIDVILLNGDYYV